MKIFQESKLKNCHGIDKVICKVTKLICSRTTSNNSYRDTELLTIHPLFYFFYLVGWDLTLISSLCRSPRFV
jgi:hypothetical protein